MSFKNEENSSIENRKLVFLLASAGYLDTQAAEYSKQLDKDRTIHHGFAVIDSLSSSYSMFRYFFEVFISNTNDPYLMHQIMTSPAGIAAIVSEAVFLVTFSFLASYFKKDTEKKRANKKDAIQECTAQDLIVISWPYFRDVMKGMKNAYKGWKSAAQIMGVLGGVDLRFMFVPVGLTLGVLASANRIWVLSMRDRRKEMMKQNAEILTSIQNSSLTKEQYNTYFDSKKLHYQTDEVRIQAYFAKTFGGLIDSLYLYAGLISLAVFSPPVFFAMSIITALYTVTCVIARIYEEYDEQLKLEVTQTKCKLALVSHELESTYKALCVLQTKTKINDADKFEIQRLKNDVAGLLDRFQDSRQLLKMQNSYSYATAIFFGIRQGLFTYGVLASFLFMVTSVFFITATVFPPVLLIACIASGLVLIFGVAAYTTGVHHRYLQSQKKEEEASLLQLVKMKEHIKAQMGNNLFSEHDFKASLNDGANSPPFYFQDWLEVLRSCFSGLSKGSNFATFIATPFHEIDAQGHDSGASMMLIMKMVGAALFSIILALRALARGDDLRRFYDKGPVISKTSCLETPQKKGEGEEPRESFASSPSLPINQRHRFFAPLDQAPQSNLIPEIDTSEDIVQGLK